MGQDDDGPPPRGRNAGTAISIDRLVDVAQCAIRYVTVNPPGSERSLAEWFGSHLSRHGFAIEYVSNGDERASLVARLRGRDERPGLILSGHLDVVPEGGRAWTHPPFAAVHESGFLYGRGAVDMKGPIAAVVEAAIVFAESGTLPAGDLIVALTAGEEVDMSGARGIVESGLIDGADAIVIAEPTNLGIAIAEKGCYRLEIECAGRAAHASTPGLGANAVLAMAEFIMSLDALDDGARHPLLGGLTCSPNVIAGGAAANVVADACRAEIDVRTLPGQSADDVVARARRIGDGVAARRGVTLTIGNLGFPPVETDPGASIVADTARAVEEIVGARPMPTGALYATDAAVLAPALGLPFVIIGPGDPALAHQVDERVAIADLARAARIYAALIERRLR